MSGEKGPQSKQPIHAEETGRGSAAIQIEVVAQKTRRSDEMGRNEGRWQ